MHLSKRIAFVAVLAGVWLGSASCGSREEPASAADSSLDRVAWLGSAEGWGFLGLPLEGGPIAYLSAENLESPTWAPPELGPITAAWSGERSIWVQFEDSRIGRYDYSTGHLLNYDSLDVTAHTAVALPDGVGLIVAPDTSTIERVAELEPWRVELGGNLARLLSTDEGWVIAVVDGESAADLLVLQPPEREALARLQTAGVRDLAITPWGGVLYYISEDETDFTVRGLALPELGATEEIPITEPAGAVAVTPSGHRLYIAEGRRLHIFDRLNRRTLREIELPSAATGLRFAANGANLLARLDGDRVAILQVGVDSLLGIVPAEWDENLPVALPGGRLLVRVGDELVLYDTPRMLEVARSEIGDHQLWLPVRWEPPRPRMELTRRTVTAQTDGADDSGASESDEATPDPGAGAPPGFYAVVSAARQLPGVENLVVWLQSVGYPSVVDRHLDVMGVTWYRAMVGPYSGRERAEAAAQELGSRYGYKPWILHMETAVEPLYEPDSGDVAVDSAAPADTLRPR